MTLTPDTMSKVERSILLYLESCAVDAGGLAEGRRMNDEDATAIEKLKAEGLLEFSRIQGTMLGSATNKNWTHWAHLTAAGWALAGNLRQLRAARLGPFATACRDKLIEAEKITPAVVA